MSLDQDWQDQTPHGARHTSATDAVQGRETGPGLVPSLFQSASGSLRQRVKRLALVALYAFRRALIPAVLVSATVFASLTYLRVETTDAKITLAFTKAEYALRLGQPGSVFSLVDKKGRLHRIPAQRLVQLPHVADLAHQTRTTLTDNSLIALTLGGFWLIFSTVSTTQRLL